MSQTEEEEDVDELAQVDATILEFEKADDISDAEWTIYAMAKIARQMQEGSGFDNAYDTLKHVTPERTQTFKSNDVYRLLILNKLVPRPEASQP